MKEVLTVTITYLFFLAAFWNYAPQTYNAIMSALISTVFLVGLLIVERGTRGI